MPLPAAAKKGSTLKKKASLSRNASLSSPPTATTLSSDANARQVTRAEFQELTFVVAQLKKDLVRNQTLASELESELQLASAQATSNKSAMGTLADLVLEKTNELQQQVTSQLQHLQVESNQRLTDMQLTLERLEFRFKHHVRDCQSIAEQVDLHQETLQTQRGQLGKTQNALDAQREEQKTFVDTMQYTVSTSEAKTAAAVDECAKRLESFQQRMVAYIKKVEEDVQDPMKAVMLQLRDLELKDKRQGALVHQAEFVTVWRN
ncbi:hypothetical protein Gpo141_00003981 [Globisporangium polare]